jgi:hypothetical protein
MTSALGYRAAILSAFGTLIALDIPEEPSGRASALRIVGTAGAAVGFLTSVLLLGALVFKLFLVNEFRWRQKLSVTRYQGDWVLIGRFYNGLDALATDVQIRANIRFVMTKQQPPIVTNAPLTLSVRRGSVSEQVWPIAYPGVPFSFRITLGPDLDPAELLRGGSYCIQGARPVDGRAEIIVRVAGEVPDPSETMRGVKSFMLPDDVDLGTPGEVNVDLSVEPTDWDGWDSFEQTRDLWIFGYGSLVAASDIERTIGRPVNTALEHGTANLLGYRRTWSAGMRNRHADPTDKHYELPDGTRPDRTISALGIEPDQDSNVNGVVFRVTRLELVALDRRERRYRRIECSHQIVADLPIPGQVFTYTPLESAMSLTAASQADGSDTVSESYKLLVEKGFESLGPEAHAAYLASTDVPTSPVMPLRVKHLD